VDSERAPAMQVESRKILIAFAATTFTLCGLLLVLVLQPLALSPGANLSNSRRLKKAQLIHVCLCSEDSDLRGAAVAIKSAYESASNPDRLRFHLVTTVQFEPVFQQLLQTHLPDIPIPVYSNSSLQARIQSFAGAHPGRQLSRTAAGPIALAPFYLEDYLGKAIKGAKKLIYIETDTVLLGDVGELLDVDLQGHTCAAAKACSTRWADLMNFDELKSMGFFELSPNSCAASRAVIVLDVHKWRRQDITGKIEEWIARSQTNAVELWKEGSSLVPWLLTIGENYAELSEQWACSGLGHETMTIEESQRIRRSGFDKKALRRLRLQTDEFGYIAPRLSTCSGSAKLLRFDGRIKPWLRDRFADAAPVCAVPTSLYGAPWVPEVSTRVKVFCEWFAYLNCSTLWWRFMTEDVSCALKDFEAEWQDQEEAWATHKKDHDWTLDMENLKAMDDVDANVRREMAMLDEQDRAMGVRGISKSEREERRKLEIKKREENRLEQKKKEKMIKDRELEMEKEEQRRIDQQRIARMQKLRAGAAGSAASSSESSSSQEEGVVVVGMP